MSTAFTEPGLDRLDRLVTRHVGPQGTPGAAWLVARGDDVHVGVAGDLADGVPVQRDSIFRIASMTKPVVAVAVLALVEDGVVRLDDPLSTLLPELADLTVLRDPKGPLEDTVALLRPPTIHDALTFRMGWGMDFADWDGQVVLPAMMAAMGLEIGPPQPGKAPPADEWIATAARFPLDHQPGERWLYNTAADVLGILVGRAAGTSFGAYLQERVFSPLGMTDTGFRVPAASLERFGDSYLPPSWSPEPGAVFDPADGQWAAEPTFESGGGGLVSTLDDFHAFARMLLDGGGPVLSRSSVAAMTTDQIVAVDGTPQGGPDPTGALGWGFGVGVVRRKTHVSESPGTYSWTGGMGTSWANDPAEGLIGICLTNRLFDGPFLPHLHQDFWTSAYTALP